MDGVNSETIDAGLIAQARQFALLDAKKRELDEELDACKILLAAAAAPLLDAFADQQSGPITLRDLGVTVYVQRQTWARPDNETPGAFNALCAALETIGLGDMVRPSVNTSTLSAWVREIIQDGGEIPEQVRSHAKITTDYSVRVKKAAKQHRNDATE